jgi:hypothetical protein
LKIKKEILNKSQQKKLLTIIDNFLELFGDDEYFIFHNEFMLPLLKRKGLIHISLKH